MQAIATLKAQQISDWLNERLADAKVVQHSQSLSESYYRWREKGDAATFAQLRNHLAEYDKQGQISGLFEVANKASDRHARKYNPAPHHARLAVNVAFTLCEFMLESYEYQQKREERRAS